MSFDLKEKEISAPINDCNEKEELKCGFVKAAARCKSIISDKYFASIETKDGKLILFCCGGCLWEWTDNKCVDYHSVTKSTNKSNQLHVLLKETLKEACGSNSADYEAKAIKEL